MQTATSTVTYAYDLVDQLVAATVGTTTETYTYSGDGIRLSAATGSQAARTVRFVVDRTLGQPSVVIERDGANWSPSSRRPTISAYRRPPPPLETQSPEGLHETQGGSNSSEVAAGPVGEATRSAGRDGVDYRGQTSRAGNRLPSRRLRAPSADGSSTSTFTGGLPTQS